MNYLVLIGDIVASKAIRNRSQFQNQFEAVLEQASRQYQNIMISPLTLTIGDEFQAVFGGTENLFQLIAFVEQQMPSVAFRYGFGLGSIVTEINTQRAIGMDGPAFHFARQAVELARKQEKSHYFTCEDAQVQERLNILLSWIDLTMKRWSDQRKGIFYFYRQKMKQRAIAEKMNLSQPAVSQNINDESFALLERTQQLVEKEWSQILT